MNDILLQNFYSEIASSFSETNQENFTCEISLNPAHPVYKGHFEQVPVAPGVCLVQTIKEILMQKFQRNLILTNGDNIKFLSLINPNETPNFTLSFLVKKEETSFHVSAEYKIGATSYAKFKGRFKVAA